MNLHPDQSVHASKTRRQQEDQRRMVFRRAIEVRAEQRRLQRELDDYPELLTADLRRVAPRAA